MTSMNWRKQSGGAAGERIRAYNAKRNGCCILQQTLRYRVPEEELSHFATALTGAACGEGVSGFVTFGGSVVKGGGRLDAGWSLGSVSLRVRDSHRQEDRVMRHVVLDVIIEVQTCVP